MAIVTLRWGGEQHECPSLVSHLLLLKLLVLGLQEHCYELVQEALFKYGVTTPER